MRTWRKWSIDRLQLGGLAALRDENRDVAGTHHAKVAVDRFGEVEEGRRRPRRGEGRCDLPGDVARLAEPADDQLAVAAEDQLHRFFERTVEAVRQGVERARLVMEDFASELQHVANHAAALAGAPGSVKLDGTFRHCDPGEIRGKQSSAAAGAFWIASSLRSSQ